MAKLITASIDLNKIDKSKIVTTDKNGQPFANGAKYLNIQISVNDTPDQYGNDCAISLNQSQEERQAKAPRTYLGNGKTVWSSDGVPATSAPLPATPIAPDAVIDDLPF